MSRAISVCHGDFGRLCYFDLNRAKVQHAQREGQLLILVKGDSLSCKVGDTSLELTTDNALLVNTFCPHEVLASESGCSSTVLSIYIDPLWYATQFSGDSAWLEFPDKTLSVSTELRHHLSHLLALIEPPTPYKQPGYHQVIETRLRQLISMFAPKPNDVMQLRPSVNALDGADPRIRKSVFIMNSHIRNELPLDEIARTAGLSRPHFYRLFRDNLGVTPNVYMNMLRMEFAVERLVFSDQPVTSIALDLGFASQASFTRFFGANLGIPPTDYRRVANVSPAITLQRTGDTSHIADDDQLSPPAASA